MVKSFFRLEALLTLSVLISFGGATPTIAQQRGDTKPPPIVLDCGKTYDGLYGRNNTGTDFIGWATTILFQCQNQVQASRDAACAMACEGSLKDIGQTGSTLADTLRKYFGGYIPDFSCSQKMETQNGVFYCTNREYCQLVVSVSGFEEILKYKKITLTDFTSGQCASGPGSTGTLNCTCEGEISEQTHEMVSVHAACTECPIGSPTIVVTPVPDPVVVYNQPDEDVQVVIEGLLNMADGSWGAE